MYRRIFAARLSQSALCHMSDCCTIMTCTSMCRCVWTCTYMHKQVLRTCSECALCPKAHHAMSLIVDHYNDAVQGRFLSCDECTMQSAYIHNQFSMHIINTDAVQGRFLARYAISACSQFSVPTISTSACREDYWMGLSSMYWISCRHVINTTKVKTSRQNQSSKSGA